jgi:DhnA family fructose-bisphosphate aldolase class Ia
MWGMPLLAMMYPKSVDAAAPMVPQLKLAARVAAELGADVVKVSYPGTVEAMQEVVDGCFVPVVVAGGERSSSDNEVLNLVKDAINGGAMGVCIGRNVFQHGQPGQFARRMSAIVHGTASEPRTRPFEVSSAVSLN